MKLLDSNIIIYLTYPEFDDLRKWIKQNNPYVSWISYVEALGYHDLKQADKVNLEAFFNSSTLVPVSFDVIKLATGLRQIRKLSLGDSLLAATALKNKMVLVTNNEQDFKMIEGLQLENPLIGR